MAEPAGRFGGTRVGYGVLAGMAACGAEEPTPVTTTFRRTAQTAGKMVLRTGRSIESLRTAVYRYPTPLPEADGTLSWDATVVVAVTVRAAGVTGLGWTYSGTAARTVIDDVLAGAVRGHAVTDIAGCWEAMHRAARNLGTRGLVAQAISAVDIALWDAKARLLHVPLGTLFGRLSPAVPVYGSGGFTTLDDQQLDAQVRRWRAAGCTAMKIKIGEEWGTRVDRDLRRVRMLAELAGPQTVLMVDANGAYDRGTARYVGDALDEVGVRWFEEPVSAADLTGLDLLRRSLRCDVAAGEYVSEPDDAVQLCPVIDCLQLDVTRCGGYTGWWRAAAVAQAHHLDLSAHCAPALHAPVAVATPGLRHVEWFIDHQRIEDELFQGVPAVLDGRLADRADVIGHGMTLRPSAAAFVLR